MIENIHHNTRTNEVRTLASSIGSRCENYDLSTDLLFHSILTDLKTKGDSLLKAINRLKVMSELDTLNGERKEALRGVFYLVQGLTFDADKAIANPSLVVLEILKRNGGLGFNKGGYKIGTTNLESMLLELSEGKIAEDISKLVGVDVRIAALKAKHDKFVSSYESFEKARALEGNTSNATDLKYEVLSVINNRLIPHLNSYCDYHPDIYGRLADEINQLIVDSNVIVRRRLKKTASAKKEDSLSEDPSAEYDALDHPPAEDTSLDDQEADS